MIRKSHPWTWRGGDGVIGVPAGIVAGAPGVRRLGWVAEPAAKICIARRTSPTSCSPTAASTTTSGSRTAWKRYDTILVSNGGGKMAPQEEPKGDWVRHAIRINEIIDNQVAVSRARQVIGSFEGQERHGPTGASAPTSPTISWRRAMPAAGADDGVGRNQNASAAHGRGPAGTADQLGLRGLRRRACADTSSPPRRAGRLPYPATGV
jgi:hypothetical protein